MPDENKNNDPSGQDEVDAVANRPASDEGGQADGPDAAPEGSSPPGAGNADAKPDGSSHGSGESASAGQTQGEAEPGEAAGETTASPVTGARGESASSSDTAVALNQEDVDAALADAGMDAPTSQTAALLHHESPIDETGASDSVDEQNLVHQADGHLLDMPDLESTQAAAEANAASIELLKDVELGVTIELGRCRMYVEDVLKLDQGAVVELDKLAGDPVDVYVNERLIARGEVLVLNDNFCVRINEIVAPVQEAETA
ncbi:MAG TPA: flagellar motor switch protein FliN [Phycisphaerae bacterium]|nr:flagellar motor switch protein FliN [Phycisphaerae bacterium]